MTAFDRTNKENLEHCLRNAEKCEKVGNLKMAENWLAMACKFEDHDKANTAAYFDSLH